MVPIPMTSPLHGRPLEVARRERLDAHAVPGRLRDDGPVVDGLVTEVRTHVQARDGGHHFEHVVEAGQFGEELAPPLAIHPARSAHVRGVVPLCDEVGQAPCVTTSPSHMLTRLASRSARCSDSGATR